MKKLVAIGLSAVMAVGVCGALAGCGGRNGRRRRRGMQYFPWNKRYVVCFFGKLQRGKSQRPAQFLSRGRGLASDGLYSVGGEL